MADNLQELKIPDGAFDTSDVKSLDDVPSMTAAELKAVFDYGAEMIVTPALNALIDFLASSKAAGALGITGLDGISGTTIQGLLQEIKKQIDDRYTKEESDLILESLVSAVKFDLETGVIRVEKRDGSFEEIDTEFDELAMQAEESAKQAVESAKQAEESAKQAIEIVGGDFATNANLQAHTEDEVRHITENERKAWNDKQDKLTFDNEPVSESLNPVTSGGVRRAVDALSELYYVLNAYIVPSGVITLWSGASDAIPNGWYLCDGSNDTPDLRDRFIVGAGGSYTVGSNGGSEKVTLTVDEMPSHNHQLGYYTTSLLVAEDETVKIIQSDSTGLKTTKIGGGKAHENRPPYYALCYIMKA